MSRIPAVLRVGPPAGPAAAAATVSVQDRRVPFTVAPISEVPALTGVTGNVKVKVPPGRFMLAGTVATAGFDESNVAVNAGHATPSVVTPLTAQLLTVTLAKPVGPPATKPVGHVTLVGFCPNTGKAINTKTNTIQIEAFISLVSFLGRNGGKFP